MRLLTKFTFLMVVGISGVAFGQADDVVPAVDDGNAKMECPFLKEHKEVAVAMTGDLQTQDRATDCYLECKPTSGGDSGDSFTRCFNECMARH